VKAAARAAVAWAVARAEEQAREKARAEEAHRVSLFRNACVRPEDARQKRWRSRAEPSRRSVRSSKLVYSANDVVTATSQRAGAPFCETASRREGHAPRRDAPITPLVCAQHARPVGRADPLLPCRPKLLRLLRILDGCTCERTHTVIQAEHACRAHGQRQLKTVAHAAPLHACIHTPQRLRP
jgi:hypothetical protein